MATTVTINASQTYTLQLQIDAPSATAAATLFDQISANITSMLVTAAQQIPGAGTVPNLTASGFVTAPWQITLTVH